MRESGMGISKSDGSERIIIWGCFKVGFKL